MRYNDRRIHEQTERCHPRAGLPATVAHRKFRTAVSGKVCIRAGMGQATTVASDGHHAGPATLACRPPEPLRPIGKVYTSGYTFQPRALRRAHGFLRLTRVHVTLSCTRE